MNLLRNILGRLWRGAPRRVRRWGVWLAEPRFTVTAGTVIRDERGRVLLLKHVFRAGAGWGIPGGFIEKDEQPDDALKRELREEIGVEIEDARIAFVRTLRRPRQVEIIYLSRVDSSAVEQPRNMEIERLAWFAPHELPSDLTADQRRLIARALAAAGAKAPD